MLNVLTEPLIRVDRNDRRQVSVSLSELYPLLLSDQVRAYPGLPPHQEHLWHAFLTQLAFLALHGRNRDPFPDSAASWADLLRGLTPDHPEDEPWQLVVNNWTRPAFLQSPASHADPEDNPEYSRTAACPDQLDLLVTARNHDVKTELIAPDRAQPDHWIFSLVTLQTAGGYSGSGNHGVARMNGGLGSRPAFSLTPSLHPGPRLRRDLTVLLTRGPEYWASASPMPATGGRRLLWLLPWNGTAAETLQLSQVDPAAVEICRRIRLQAHTDQSGARRISARRASTKAPRIAAKDKNGAVGDPWTPLNIKDPKAPKSLTLPAGGFTHRRIAAYLSDPDWQLPLLALPTPEEAAAGRPILLSARGLVRGQGKTEGWYEQDLPLQPATLQALATDPEADNYSGATPTRADLTRIVKERLETADKAKRILSQALQTYAAGGVPPHGADRRQEIQPYLDAINHQLDQNFFDDLQTELSAAPDARPELRVQWEKAALLDPIDTLFRQGLAGLPTRTGNRRQARSNAESLFYSRLRGPNGFPHHYSRQQESAA